MGLYNDALIANRYVDTELQITYSKTKVYGSWAWSTGNLSGWYDSMWEYHRYAKKSYRYVGMTHNGALEAQNDFIAYYTRNFRLSTWDGTCLNGQWVRNTSGQMLMADIAVQHVAGNMWQLVITVDEDDMYMSFWGNESFSTIFATEDQRTYDV